MGRRNFLQIGHGVVGHLRCPADFWTTSVFSISGIIGLAAYVIFTHPHIRSSGISRSRRSLYRENRCSGCFKQLFYRSEPLQFSFRGLHDEGISETKPDSRKLRIAKYLRISIFRKLAGILLRRSTALSPTCINSAYGGETALWSLSGAYVLRGGKGDSGQSMEIGTDISLCNVIIVWNIQK